LVAGAHIAITPSGKPDTTRARPAPEKKVRRWTMNADHIRVRRAQLDAPGNVHLRDVDLTASGRPDAYRAIVNASGSAWRFDRMRAFVRASGSSRAATADSLEVDVLDGVVHGSAFVRWSPGISWRAHLGGDGLHVGEMAKTPAEWLGEL